MLSISVLLMAFVKLLLISLSSYIKDIGQMVGIKYRKDDNMNDLLKGLQSVLVVFALCLPFILFADEPDLVDALKLYLQNCGG